MTSPHHHNFLARILYIESKSVIAEFNRYLHLPLPPFGSLVKIDCRKYLTYGLISDARLKGESQAQNAEFFENPVPLDTEIHILPVGFQSKEIPSSIPIQDVPPEMPAAGDYVFMPNDDELQLFTIDLGFLKILLTDPIATAEGLIITAIRKFSTIYPDPQSYLIRVTQELSRLTYNDREIVGRILNRTINQNPKYGIDERIKS
ncbi:hypothetical protein JNM05_08380 [bacterium]|nr:hypothetical protein [bacterium]